jgi:hypothetical protein
LYLNSSQAQTNYGSTLWAPTSTTFATNLATLSNRDAVAYLWHGVDGFSKFGSFSGNGDTSGVGPFIYLGFKPSWLLIKNISSATGWILWDNKRNLFNPVNNYLIPSANSAEASDDSQKVDFLSNGFKVKNTASSSSINASGSIYIYMAFAEHPFVGDGTNPVTAR